MNQEVLNNFQVVVHELFIRWDALKLAVEHMGGRNGQQTAREIRDYAFNYCTQNDNIQQDELVDLLSDVMNEEFDAICEDNSVNDLSLHLVEYLKLCIQGNFESVRQHLGQLPKCVNWLDPSFTITRPPRGDDSDSSSDSGSDEDMEMSDDDEDGEAPESVSSNQRNQRNRPTTDDDGWTTIPTRRR